MKHLLTGFRVIESSTLLNGASTTMMLADLGAEIIKVESPFLGDYIRIPDTIELHLQTNKNKKSIAIDLRKPEGGEIFKRLLNTADVFVTNAVADRNKRLGLAYVQLKQIKPDIVYCQNTGFGATGPYASIPTHGQMMDCLAGAMPVEMGADGLTQPREGLSVRTGSLASAGEGTAAGAIYAAFHIASALAHRERTGEGAYIDVSSAEAVICSAWIAGTLQANRPDRTDWWQNKDNTKPVARYQSYQTRDGKFILFCPEEKKFWHAFCDLIEREDLKSQSHGEDLRRELQTIFDTRDRDQWVEFAITHRLPLGPVNDGMDEVSADPQIVARDLLYQGVGADKDDSFVYIGQPAHVSGMSRPPLRKAPELGEHSTEILTELGYSEQDIRTLKKDLVTAAETHEHDHISPNVYGENST